MKNLLIVFLITSFAATATAQKQQLTDSATLKGLPVLRSYVAPDVVERAKKKYGRLLYCIEKTTADNCENSYLVGLLQNRKLVREWMCDDPKMVFQSKRSPGISEALAF